MKTVGETLIHLLEGFGVDVMFGIPGVHTVEMYRGLKGSAIRHVTPRDEQSAGFMADGYARATGRPGVCLLITGPGVTNAITPMAQARADSVPMLVISGVNRAETFDHEEGFLHELPDQGATMRSVASWSHTLHRAEDLPRVLTRAFAAMTGGRPGPVHLEIPLDVMRQKIATPSQPAPVPTRHVPDPAQIAEAAARIRRAKRPLILAGGGAVAAAEALVPLAEAMDAPVVTTINARGILGGHPLCVPASPTLAAPRALMAEADLVLAIGTQFGRTDYDMFEDGGLPGFAHLIRIDCDPVQITRGRLPDLGIVADSGAAVEALGAELSGLAVQAGGASRAQTAREAARAALSPEEQAQINMLHQINRLLPGCRIVGDSTQAVYAGNMYVDMPAPRLWYNAATGYGALGYAAPAAIGAAFGDPDRPVLCLTGDGGLQFCLAELGTAIDEKTPVIFLVWNNNGYQEIERYMVRHDIAPEGVKPSAPDFVQVAAAYGMGGETVPGLDALPAALERARDAQAPWLIDLMVP